jgi:3-dehydrotetronate 4-kinase
VLLGCIADDLTGATDVAGALVGAGLRVRLEIGVPDRATSDAGDTDAVVVALKSRSMAADAAVDLSLRALERLRAGGARRIYFKYASTFDSTAAGNIGPVTEALQDAVDARITVACPAYPANGRTVTGGELLVRGRPLAESPMRHHPLNPMVDSNLVRLLGAQTTRPVGLVAHERVRNGSSGIRRRLDTLARTGTRHAIVDATDDADLAAIAQAVIDDRLVTGASSLAGAMAARLSHAGSGTSGAPSMVETDVRPAMPAAVIAGSCSAATLRQIEVFSARHATLTIDPVQAAQRPGLVGTVLSWAAEHLPRGPILIATSAPPEAVARVAGALGPDAGPAIERMLGAIAAGLVEAGVGRMVVAGGETSGAVVEALGLRSLEVGAQIEPGVPIVTARDPQPLRLALKSGNFGSDDFFEIALGAMAL